MTGPQPTGTPIHQPTRRLFLSAAAGTLLAAVTVSRALGNHNTEHVCSLVRKRLRSAYYKEYSDTYGVEPDQHIFEDEDAMLAWARSGQSFDVAYVDAEDIDMWRSADVIRTIDVSALSRWPEVIGPLTGAPGVLLDGSIWGVPIAWGIEGIAYRSDSFKPASNSLAVLFEPSGAKIAMRDSFLSIVFAARALGLADPYALNEEEFSRVATHLKDQRRIVRAYWTNIDELTKLMTEGEVTLAMAPSWGVRVLAERMPDIRFVAPEEGAVAWTEAMTISSNTDDESIARYFINAMLSVDAGLQFMDVEATGYSNQKALDSYISSEPDAARKIGLGGPGDLENAMWYRNPDNELLQRSNQLLADLKQA